MRRKHPNSRMFNLVTLFNPKSGGAEAYRVLRTNIQFANVDKQLHTIMITSATAGEGKTTNSANIAITFAQAGNNVLLIDADMRKPRIHTAFNRGNTKGLSLAITDIVNYKANILHSEIGRLDIMPSGPIPPNPAELLSSESFEALIGILKSEYDYIFLDSPPAIFSDTTVLATRCDGVLVVVSAGMADKKVIKHAVEQLENVKANLLGVVLNNVEVKKNTYGYGYYGYLSEQYDSYGKPKKKKRKRKDTYSVAETNNDDEFLDFINKSAGGENNGD